MKNYFFSKWWFLLRLFVIRRRIQFQQTCQIFCVKSLNNSCSDLKKNRKVKNVQKNQIVVLETQNKVSTTMRTKYCQKSIFFLSTLSPIMIKKTSFFETIVIFSKRAPVQEKRSPDERAEFSQQTVRQIFV